MRLVLNARQAAAGLLVENVVGFQKTTHRYMVSVAPKNIKLHQM